MKDPIAQSITHIEKAIGVDDCCVALRNDNVRRMYSVMNAIENNIGGGEGVEGLYGSVRGKCMQRILTTMRQHCGLDSSSHLIDIGAGLGRPLLHALVTEGISNASGIELDYIKCMKAEAFLRQSITAIHKKNIVSTPPPIPHITCSNIEQSKTLGPATHAYSFWEGIPISARISFGRLFQQSSTLHSIAVVQRSLRGVNLSDPAKWMEEAYGFGKLVLVDSFPVQMSGSGSQFQAYVFHRANFVHNDNAVVIRTPSREREEKLNFIDVSTKDDDVKDTKDIIVGNKKYNNKGKQVQANKKPRRMKIQKENESKVRTSSRLLRKTLDFTKFA